MCVTCSYRLLSKPYRQMNKSMDLPKYGTNTGKEQSISLFEMRYLACCRQQLCLQLPIQSD